jgi:hypothetical protein
MIKEKKIHRVIVSDEEGLLWRGGVTERARAFRRRGAVSEGGENALEFLVTII